MIVDGRIFENRNFPRLKQVLLMMKMMKMMKMFYVFIISVMT